MSFFSGTDQKELEDGHKDRLYYVSIIVNNHSPIADWKCKIAFKGVNEVVVPCTITSKILDSTTGQWIETSVDDSRKTSEDVMYSIDCDIEMDENSPEAVLTDQFKERFEELERECKPAYTYYKDKDTGFDENYGCYGVNTKYKSRETNHQLGMYNDYKCSKCKSDVYSYDGLHGYCMACRDNVKVISKSSRPNINLKGSSKIKVTQQYVFNNKESKKSFVGKYLADSISTGFNHVESAINSALIGYNRMHPNARENKVEEIMDRLDVAITTIIQNNKEANSADKDFSENITFCFYRECINILDRYKNRELVKDLISFIKQITEEYECK